MLSTIFESLVWLNLGLNPSLLDYWRTLLCFPHCWLQCPSISFPISSSFSLLTWIDWKFRLLVIELVSRFVSLSFTTRQLRESTFGLLSLQYVRLGGILAVNKVIIGETQNSFYSIAEHSDFIKYTLNKLD